MVKLVECAAPVTIIVNVGMWLWDTVGTSCRSLLEERQSGNVKGCSKCLPCPVSSLRASARCRLQRHESTNLISLQEGKAFFHDCAMLYLRRYSQIFTLLRLDLTMGFGKEVSAI